MGRSGAGTGTGAQSGFRDGSRLAVVNAKFDSGFPPTATSFDVVIVDGR